MLRPERRGWDLVTDSPKEAMRRTAAIIALAAGTTLVALGFASAASAAPTETVTPLVDHVANIFGTPSCPNPGQGWQVVWTISNADELAATVTATTPPSSAVGQTIPGGGSITTAPTPVAQETPSLGMQAELVWGDDTGSAISPIASLPPQCVTPTPTATTPTPTPTATTPAPPVTTTPTPEPPKTTSVPVPTASQAGPFFPNCAAVVRAGKAPLLRGQPGYRRALDSDNDGIACEQATPAPAPTRTAVIVPVGSVAGGELPNTGPGPLLPLLAAGGGLLAFGAGLLVVGRRRRTT